MKLKDKIAVVTGASRGIGRAVAYRFTQEGAEVIAVARNTILLDSLMAEIAKGGGKATRLAADISSDSDCRAVIEKALSLHGRIDVLVNNAGLLGSRTEVTSIDSDEWRLIFNTNVAGTFMLSKYAALRMKERNSGSIINLTSGVVRHPSP